MREHALAWHVPSAFRPHHFRLSKHGKPPESVHPVKEHNATARQRMVTHALTPPHTEHYTVFL